ncbi:NAD-dependent epimerase/dehydratase family protein [Melghirimyces algeriensis]|uniref:Dihydroflavonol-4-reductase n=1 Tax=Melghirimyces algeriensis TaxID=910412 RepID=A0A521AWQ6_9BACL|nr:NAD-dependent epimerase/dehydratase family protein [Melghirimyces algeriensis]SMO39268.1 dihydroflavonol-4-reductase [Melghirimyces algeriensis]
MRVLVTGGTGFLGRHLIHPLLKQGMEVTVLYRRESGKERLPEILRKEIRFVKGDILNPESLQGCLRGMEWVIHTAGEVAWGRGQRKKMMDSHITGTKNMVSEAMSSDVSRFIQTSSAAAVGFSLNGSSVDETFPFNGDRLNNGYAMAKRQAEQLVMKEAHTGRLPGVVVNPTVIMGESHPGFIKEVARGKLRFALEGGVNICDINDVVQGHLLAAKKGRVGERYILGGTDLSLRRLFQEVADCAGTGQTIATLPRWMALGASVVGEAVGYIKGKEAPLAWDIARLSGTNIYYRSTKAEQELGYKRRSLTMTIQSCIEWMQKNNCL